VIFALNRMDVSHLKGDLLKENFGLIYLPRSTGRNCWKGRTGYG